jgi:hypothetical protein
MYASFELVGEHLMDEAMASDAAHPFERSRYDRDLEVRLGAARNIVLVALVLDEKGLGSESLAELVFDPALKDHDPPHSSFMNPQRQAKILAFALACAACPPPSELPPYEPPLLEPHVVHVLADAIGTATSPARVALFLQRGALRVTGGAAHLVEGVATGAEGDPPPRVDVGADRVSIVQAEVGGAPPKGDATFELKLGARPILLSVDTGSGESQSIDLGGVSVTTARVHVGTGRVSIDWSRPSALEGGRLELSTEAGTVEVTHLGRFGGRLVEVKEGGGLVTLDLGDRIDKDLAIDAEVGTGKLTLRLPRDVAAQAHVTPPASHVVVNAWRPLGDGFVLGDASLAPRVVIHVRCASGVVELVAS